MLLSVENLVTNYQTKRGPLSAVDDVSFDLAEGQTLGLVGESGCGKSTIAKSILRLVRPSSGRIVVDGVDIAHLSERELKEVRPKVQMIFQDPYASLNPRKTVGRILDEPLQVHKRGTASERREQVEWLMERVGLRPESYRRYPHEFSGGQRQRIGIARALALKPKIVICDEPVSALDVSVRAQVLNLLLGLQEDFGFSYLFISHDLSVVRHISDRVAVMYLGKIVEVADNATIWDAPRHPYTKALISAVPAPGVVKKRERGRGVLQGDIPNPIAPPSGCRFRTRCGLAEAACATTSPELKYKDRGHRVACHLA